MKKIAVTQTQMEYNSVTYDCLDPRWYPFLAPNLVIPVPNLPEIELDIDVLILSGGKHSPARTQCEIRQWTECLKYDIPIIGVCHGAFFLNYLYDGLNKEINNHRGEDHEIILENEKVTVNSYHDTGIFTLGKELEPIATCVNDGSIEAFKHESMKMWGLLWHPERMKVPVLPTEVRELLYD